MRTTSVRLSLLRLPVVCLALVWGASFAGAASAETITATAQLKTSGGVNATAPVTITIEHLSTDADRDALLAAIKKGGTEAARGQLLTQKPIGTVVIGKQSSAIKYAYSRPTSGGRLVTIVTGSPIAYIGASLPGAATKNGFYLGLILVEIAGSASHGEIAAATKVKVDAQGAVVTDDYSSDMIRLIDITSK